MFAINRKVVVTMSDNQIIINLLCSDWQSDNLVWYYGKTRLDLSVYT